MEAHPIANLFPMMNNDEYAALVADIHQHGQREPIWLLDGAILDGRNRWQACRDLGIRPLTRDYTGTNDTASLITFVVSLNLKRRHLNSGQRAVVALDIEKVLAEEARNNKVEAGRLFGEGHGKEEVFQIFEKPLEPIHAAEQAAAIVGTNRQYVSDAKKLAQQAPDLLEEVRSGALTLPEAKREIKARTKEQARQDRANNPPPVLPDACVIEHGDSTEHLPANSVNAIITDPPYGISHYGGVTKVGDQIVTADFDADDAWDSIDPAQFLDTLYSWIEEWERLLKAGGSVIAFCDRALVSHMWDAMKRVGLKPKQILVWEKTNPNPAGFARRNLLSATEFMVWAVAPGAPYTFNDVEGWDRRNVIVTPIIGGHEKVDHPTQKPLTVMMKLVALVTHPGDLVLDPFGGSGSTADAALQLGRRAHLIEQDIDYVRLARERLATHTQERAA